MTDHTPDSPAGKVQSLASELLYPLGVLAAAIAGVLFVFLVFT